MIHMQYQTDNRMFPLVPRLDIGYASIFLYDHTQMQHILLVLSSSGRTLPKVSKASAPSQGFYFQPLLQNTVPA